MKKADGIGRRLVYGALLAASALLLLLMVKEQIFIAPRTAYTASAPQVEVTQLPSLPESWLLNSGDADALDALPGVGPVLAQRIIENREADGPFVFPEDAMEVKGIGEKTLSGILQWLSEHPEAAQ